MVHCVVISRGPYRLGIGKKQINGPDLQNKMLLGLLKKKCFAKTECSRFAKQNGQKWFAKTNAFGFAKKNAPSLQK